MSVGRPFICTTTMTTLTSSSYRRDDWCVRLVATKLRSVINALFFFVPLRSCCDSIDHQIDRLIVRSLSAPCCTHSGRPTCQPIEQRLRRNNCDYLQVIRRSSTFLVVFLPTAAPFDNQNVATSLVTANPRRGRQSVHCTTRVVVAPALPRPPTRCSAPERRGDLCSARPRSDSSGAMRQTS